MKDKDIIKNSFGDFKELKEAKELYTKCLDAKIEDYETIENPSLKYELYTLLFFEIF